MNKKQLLINLWIDSSDADMEAAKTLLETRPHLNSIILFHCQQAIEKLLKALLIDRDIQVRKIHDLNKLLSFLKMKIGSQPLFMMIFRYLKNLMWKSDILMVK